MITHISTKQGLENFIKENESVLIDFYATWCGPCRMLAPSLEELDEENFKAKIVKIDVDEAEEIAREYHIQAIPTLIYYEHGELKNKFTGFMRKDQIVDFCK